MLLVLVLLFPLILTESKFNSSKFCDNKCENRIHPACKCLTTKPDSSDYYYEILDNIVDFRRKIVEAHNKIRNKIASGKAQISGGTLPSAENMLLLNYDLELEFLVRCNQRVQSLDWGKDDVCETTYNGEPLTLNHGFVEDKIAEWEIEVVDDWTTDGSPKITQMIKSNFNETILNSMKRKKKTIDMIHVIWWSFNRLGCVRMRDKKEDYHLFCFYTGDTDADILDGKPIYKLGNSCSTCPENITCNENMYTSLCGKELPIPEAVVDLPKNPEIFDSDDTDDEHDVLKKKLKTKQKSAQEKPTISLSAVTLVVLTLLINYIIM